MNAPTSSGAVTARMVQRATEQTRRTRLIKAALRPLVITAGVMAAAAVTTAPAQADPPPPSPGSITSALNGAGFGNNGQMNNAVAGVGQSICPMLVKPGASLATMASQLGGSTGLPPGIVNMVASMAIQSQCPGFMSSLANGQMPGPLQGLAGGANPLQGLGGNPAPAMPGAPAPGAPAQTTFKMPFM